MACGVDGFSLFIVIVQQERKKAGSGSGHHVSDAFPRNEKRLMEVIFFEITFYLLVIQRVSV